MRWWRKYSNLLRYKVYVFWVDYKKNRSWSECFNRCRVALCEKIIRHRIYLWGAWKNYLWQRRLIIWKITIIIIILWIQCPIIFPIMFYIVIPLAIPTLFAFLEFTYHEMLDQVSTGIDWVLEWIKELIDSYLEPKDEKKGSPSDKPSDKKK